METVKSKGMVYLVVIILYLSINYIIHWFEEGWSSNDVALGYINVQYIFMFLLTIMMIVAHYNFSATFESKFKRILVTLLSITIVVLTTNIKNAFTFSVNNKDTNGIIYFFNNVHMFWSLLICIILIIPIILKKKISFIVESKSEGSASAPAPASTETTSPTSA